MSRLEQRSHWRAEIARLEGLLKETADPEQLLEKQKETNKNLIAMTKHDKVWQRVYKRQQECLDNGGHKMKAMTHAHGGGFAGLRCEVCSYSEYA